MSSRSILRTTFAMLVLSGSLEGHAGRRLEVDVLDGQLVARGFNSGSDDGGGAIRSYLNSIHDHWQPYGGGFAANLPGFTVFAGPSGGAGDLLAGGSLILTLDEVSVWQGVPPHEPPGGWVPEFEPLGNSWAIAVHDEFGGVVTSMNPGMSLTLGESLPGFVDSDLDLFYQLSGDPAGNLFLLEWTLSALGTTETYADSDTIRMILSPPGADPAERLHHASLFVEEALGSPVPEPAALAFLALALPLLLRRLRQPSGR